MMEGNEQRHDWMDACFFFAERWEKAKQREANAPCASITTKAARA